MSGVVSAVLPILGPTASTVQSAEPSSIDLRSKRFLSRRKPLPHLGNRGLRASLLVHYVAVLSGVESVYVVLCRIISRRCTIGDSRASASHALNWICAFPDEVKHVRKILHDLSVCRVHCYVHATRRKIRRVRANVVNERL